MINDMRLLIGGAPSKFFHLQELSIALKKYGIDCKLVHDEEFSNGFPNRKVSNWIANPNGKKESL